MPFACLSPHIRTQRIRASVHCCFGFAIQSPVFTKEAA